MHSFGWDAVNMGMFPAIALAVIALGWLVLANRRAATQGA